MRKLAFRYRRVREIYNKCKGNVGGEYRDSTDAQKAEKFKSLIDLNKQKASV